MTTRQAVAKHRLSRLTVVQNLKRADREGTSYPCKHGHFDCSFTPEGPCFNEMESLYYGYTGRQWSK